MKKLENSTERNERKNKFKHFELWKKWTIEHGVTPIQTSEDEEEKRLAINISAVISRMKKKPEQYEDVISEYENICTQYGRRKNDKTPVEHFQIWKEWTLQNECMPSKKSKNNEEHKVARNMSDALRKMRANPETYKNVLEEYNEIHSKYTIYKNNKTEEEIFEDWKKWTLDHEVTPLQQAENNEEKTIAIRMMHTLQKMKKNPQKYGAILEEYQDLKDQYGRSRANSLTKSKSKNTPMKNLKNRNKSKDKQTVELHFKVWKEWTLEHGVVPSQHSIDEEERRVAVNMRNALQKMKKEPDKYKEILAEHKQIHSEYGIRNIKKLQKEKQELLSLTRALKHDAYDSEQLYIESKYAISRIMDKKIQRLEGPGE